MRSFLAALLALTLLAVSAVAQTPAAPPPATGATLLQAVVADAANVQADQAAITAAQGKLTVDTAQQTADVKAFVAFLSAVGPTVGVNPDGSYTIYAATPTGYAATPAVALTTVVPSAPAPAAPAVPAPVAPATTTPVGAVRYRLVFPPTISLARKAG